MATFTEMTLGTTVNGSSVQLPVSSGTGWSSSAGTLTLSPASTPAIYGFTINAPSGYTFTGSGTSLSYGSNADATYTVLVANDVTTAYLVACDGLSSGSANNSLTLNLSNGTSTVPLTATVTFQ